VLSDANTLTPETAVTVERLPSGRMTMRSSVTVDEKGEAGEKEEMGEGEETGEEEEAGKKVEVEEETLWIRADVAVEMVPLDASVVSTANV
jgi:hypothetical protein